jgi:hypothetical protein
MNSFQSVKENTRRNPWSYKREIFACCKTRGMKRWKSYCHRSYRAHQNNEFARFKSNKDKDDCHLYSQHKEWVDAWNSPRDCDPSEKRYICTKPKIFRWGYLQRQYSITEPRVIASYKHKTRKMDLNDQAEDYKWWIIQRLIQSHKKHENIEALNLLFCKSLEFE